jgi:hypothetical protein
MKAKTYHRAARIAPHPNLRIGYAEPLGVFNSRAELDAAVVQAGIPQDEILVDEFQDPP